MGIPPIVTIPTSAAWVQCYAGTPDAYEADRYGRAAGWRDPRTCGDWLAGQVRECLDLGYGVIVLNRPGGNIRGQIVTSNPWPAFTGEHIEAMAAAARECEDRDTILAAYIGFDDPIVADRQDMHPAQISLPTAWTMVARCRLWYDIGVRELWLDWACRGHERDGRFRALAALMDLEFCYGLVGEPAVMGEERRVCGLYRWPKGPWHAGTRVPGGGGCHVVCRVEEMGQTEAERAAALDRLLDLGYWPAAHTPADRVPVMEACRRAARQLPAAM